MKNDSTTKKNGANGAAQQEGVNGKSSQKETKSPLLEKFFTDMLKDIYWAEKHLVETLPEMKQAATTDELQEAFDDHYFATQKHVSRLEKVFKLLGKEPEAKKCEAMAGLVKEAQSIIGETKEGTMTRDVGLIIAAQKIEHYEIATYGSLVQLARTMDNCEEIATILEKTLWEEEDTDQHLTAIAESSINPAADDEGQGEENTEQSSTNEKNEKNEQRYANATASMS